MRAVRAGANARMSDVRYIQESERLRDCGVVLTLVRAEKCRSGGTDRICTVVVDAARARPSFQTSWHSLMRDLDPQIGTTRRGTPPQTRSSQGGLARADLAHHQKKRESVCVLFGRGSVSVERFDALLWQTRRATGRRLHAQR